MPVLPFVSGPLAAVDADALVLFVDGDAPPAEADAFGEAVALAAADARALKRPAMLPRPGAGPRRLVVVAADAGPSSLVDPTGLERWRWAAASAADALAGLPAERVVLAVPDAPGVAGALVEGFRLAAYRYTRYKTGDAASEREVAVHAAAPDAVGDAVRDASVRAVVTNRARDLVNRSPDEKTPERLAELMREDAEATGLGVEVWDMDRLQREGMGGILGVNRGSVDPPRFVVLEWAGAQDAAPVVLVGKAVTFDTGGLSLKSTKGSMDKMKADMAGGAAVFGAMLGVARLGLPIRAVALIPMSDNRPGERAYVPGDVLRMHSGATVEVLNTDAEGRLLLADALSYARGLSPRLVVDVATLTGAQGVALGERVAGVVVRPGDEPLAEAVRQAGEATGDLAWPLPLYGHYRAQLESPVADLQNVGGPMAGLLTAAAFLDHFTRDADGEPAYPWIHLDIARPAFLDAPYGYRPKGASGFGVRLLLDLLQSHVLD